MPNWVVNDITISGDIKELKEINSLFCQPDNNDEDNEVFNFHKIMPLPKDLLIDESHQMRLGLELYKKFVSSLLFSGFDVVNRELSKAEEKMLEDKEQCFLGSVLKEEDEKTFKLGKQAYNNIQKYGYPSWYGWCIHNWGTKWNACNSSIYFEENAFVGGPQLYIFFYTAWDTPIGIFKALSKKFPNVKINVDYADEDIGNNCGKIILQNGNIISHNVFAEGSSEAIDFACELWNYDPDEYYEEVEE